MPEFYEIKIKGHLDSHWSDWFAGLKLTHLEGDETLLSGPLPDLRPAHLPAPPDLPSLQCSTSADRRLQTPGNTGIDSHIRYGFIERRIR